MPLLDMIQEIIKTEYADHFKSIRSISFDEANKIEMCDSDFKCWDFDGIIKKYSDEKGIEEVSSPDMLYFVKDSLIFVEFKNGKFTKRTKRNVRLKIVEGAYIGLKELLEHQNVSFSLDELNSLKRIYIVVYNQGRKKKRNDRNPAKLFHERMNRLKTRHEILSPLS